MGMTMMHDMLVCFAVTGVFQSEAKNCSIDAAKIVVDDVLGAVDAALHRTRSLRFHSMR